MKKCNLQDLGVRAANIALEEWWYFGCQFVDGEDSGLAIKSTSAGHGNQGRGDLPGYQERVWSYFRHGVYCGYHNMRLSGDSSNREAEWLKYKSWAWSGAFISYCIRRAGAGSHFSYSPAHHRYMMAGIQNRLNNATGPKTYDINERPPQIGDLIWKGRSETREWTYRHLRDHGQSDGRPFRSHCDLVVDINPSGNELFAIGGNVKNRVLRLKLRLDDDGLIESDIYTALLSLDCGND